MTDQKVEDINEYKKLTSVLRNDLVDIKKKYDAERSEKEQMTKRFKEMNDEYSKIKKHIDIVKEEKKQYYSGLINDKIDPYFDNLRKTCEHDSRMKNSIDRFQENVKSGLDDGYMDQDKLSMMNFVVATSSANQITSSKLEELFKSQNEWKERFEKKDKEHSEIIQKTAEEKEALLNEKKKAEEIASLLKEELDNLRKKHKTSVADPTTHVEEETLESPTVTATSSSFHNGFETLFDFTPRPNW